MIDIFIDILTLAVLKGPKPHFYMHFIAEVKKKTVSLLLE